METSNEELKSANEELQSVNEEAQSTNEELETSKEELQSVNEELATVNAELQTKVNDLSQANNDMNNLLAGTGVATLFVDHQLRITRFTPDTAELINLIRTDIGRPVSHLASNLKDYDRLAEDVKGVLDTLVPREAEVQTVAGGWFLMRTRPYRTLENVIEGAVITFVDITDRRLAEQAGQRAQALAESIIATVREPLVVLDDELMVASANPSFFRAFGGAQEDTLGRHFFALGRGMWDIPELRRLLEEVLPHDAAFEGFEVTHDFEGLGRRTVVLNARRVLSDGLEPGRILLAFEDLTAKRPRGAGRSKAFDSGVRALGGTALVADRKKPRSAPDPPARAGTEPRPPGDVGAALRRRAEDAIAAWEVETEESAPTPEDARRLLHELRVHQVELEMQNEELRRAQEELEAEDTPAATSASSPSRMSSMWRWSRL